MVWNTPARSALKNTFLLPDAATKLSQAFQDLSRGTFRVLCCSLHKRSEAKPAGSARERHLPEAAAEP